MKLGVDQVRPAGGGRGWSAVANARIKCRAFSKRGKFRVRVVIKGWPSAALELLARVGLEKVLSCCVNA